MLQHSTIGSQPVGWVQLETLDDEVFSFIGDEDAMFCSWELQILLNQINLFVDVLFPCLVFIILHRIERNIADQHLVGEDAEAPPVGSSGE